MQEQRIEDRWGKLVIEQAKKSRWRAFWDFFILFSGISTASNLSRTQAGRSADEGCSCFARLRKNSGPRNNVHAEP